MQHPAAAVLAAGVTLGLLSGALNAVAFLISRHQATASRGGGLRLLVAAYGLVWLGGMLTLYACFGLLGAVFGNVLLSSRGLFAVIIGAVLAHRGWHELEQQIDRAALVRRIAAAVLMTAAIALYVIDVW
jgi:hypothetical protein